MSVNFPKFDPERIEAALFALLQTAIGPLPINPGDPILYPFVTATRNPSLPQNVPAANQPLLGLISLGASQVESQAQGLEKWLLHFRVVVYIRADATSDAIPSQQINYALKAIVFAMRSSATFERQRLGGLVDDASIEGDILRDNGNIDKQCALLIPIVVDLGV